MQAIENLNPDLLQEQLLLGRTWLMKDLREWTGGKSANWLKENILLNPKYADDFKAMQDAGYIYRGTQGVPWKFKASVMAKWLDEHWNELNW